MATLQKQPPKVNAVNSGELLHKIDSGFVAKLGHRRVRNDVDRCDRLFLNECFEDILHRSPAGFTHVIGVITYRIGAERVTLQPHVSGEESNMLFEVQGS